MRFITKTINFLLYTNIWIAGSATALYYYTKYQFTNELSTDYTGPFVFFTSVWVYSIHRFIGLKRVDPSRMSYRYRFIEAHLPLLKGVATLSIIASLALVCVLTWMQIVTLIIPGILSLLYVLPIFKKRRRLRDYNYIKLFIIALVWGGLTVLLPLESCSECHAHTTLFLIFLERCMFVFALTLPFDIRDLNIDAVDNVKTLATILGVQGVWLTCLLMLTFSNAIFLFLFAQGLVGAPILYIHLATNLLTLLAVGLALWRRHDWYYTGLLDGTMYLPFVFLYLYLVLG